MEFNLMRLMSDFNWNRLIANREIDPITKCWNWKGAKSDGYGYIQTKGKIWLVHRLVAHISLGLKECDSRLVLHKCNNSSCFNPLHLKIGDQQENMEDKIKAGHSTISKRTYCKRGHEYTKENTRIETVLRGSTFYDVQRCKTCNDITKRARQQKG
jgi:hypothetical protein